MTLARLIHTLTTLVVAVIVLGILLWILSANPHNVLVRDIHDAGKWLVGPFKTLFSVKGAKLHLALNWGLAAVIYSAVGHALARFSARGALAGTRRLRRVRPVA